MLLAKRRALRRAGLSRRKTRDGKVEVDVGFGVVLDVLSKVAAAQDLAVGPLDLLLVQRLLALRAGKAGGVKDQRFAGASAQLLLLVKREETLAARLAAHTDRRRSVADGLAPPGP